jgi:hypothetical protein
MEHKAELRQAIHTLTDYILGLAPEVCVRDESVIYEDEHGNLEIYPPLTWDEEQCMDLQEKIGERVSDLHLETGFLILVYVVTPLQQVVEAQQELARVKQKEKCIEKVLAEAAALGLLKVESSQMELVAA